MCVCVCVFWWSSRFKKQRVTHKFLSSTYKSNMKACYCTLMVLVLLVLSSTMTKLIASSESTSAGRLSCMNESNISCKTTGASNVEQQVLSNVSGGDRYKRSGVEESNCKDTGDEDDGNGCCGCGETSGGGGGGGGGII